jgi:hypothetical protein
VDLRRDRLCRSLLGRNVHWRVERKYEIAEYKKPYGTNGVHSLRRQQ